MYLLIESEFPIIPNKILINNLYYRNNIDIVTNISYVLVHMSKSYFEIISWIKMFEINQYCNSLFIEKRKKKRIRRLSEYLLPIAKVTEIVLNNVVAPCESRRFLRSIASFRRWASRIYRSNEIRDRWSSIQRVLFSRKRIFDWNSLALTQFVMPFSMSILFRIENSSNVSVTFISTIKKLSVYYKKV